MTEKVTRAVSRPKAFWQHHIRQWKKSDQSKAKYCREQKLNAGTFYNWCSEQTRAAQSDKTNGAGRVKLFPVTLRETAVASANGNSPSVSLEHSLGRFTFPPGLPSQSIEQWLRAIGQSNVQS